MLIRMLVWPKVKIQTSGVNYNKDKAFLKLGLVVNLPSLRTSIYTANSASVVDGNLEWQLQ